MYAIIHSFSHSLIVYLFVRLFDWLIYLFIYSLNDYGRCEWRRGEEWRTTSTDAWRWTRRLWRQLQAGPCLRDVTATDVADWSRLRPPTAPTARTSPALRYVLSHYNIGSEEILEIAEAAISAILAACRDFWQMPRFRNAAVNLCDCPTISDYTHQLSYTLLHINRKWLLHVKMFTPETRQTDSNCNIVILTEPLWNNMLVTLLRAL